MFSSISIYYPLRLHVVVSFLAILLSLLLTDEDDDVPASDLTNIRKGSEAGSENDGKHTAKEDDHGIVGSRNANRSRGNTYI